MEFVLAQTLLRCVLISVFFFFFFRNLSFSSSLVLFFFFLTNPFVQDLKL